MKMGMASLAMICFFCANVHADLETPSHEIRGRIPSMIVDSLEWMVWDADAIIRAKVSKQAHTLEGGGQWFRFEAEVVETLKGQVSRNVVFTGWSGGAWPDTDEWLLFLKRRTRFTSIGEIDDGEWELGQHGGRFNFAASQAVPLDGSGAVETLGRRYLTERSEILAALAKSLEETRHKTRPGSILLFNFSPWQPSDLIDIVSPSLRVPLDDQLQREAWVWARRRFPRDPNNTRRFVVARMQKLEAIRVLSRVHSNENIAVLREMLDDPYPDEGYGEVLRTSSSDYSIRYRAWEALRDWGVEVERPVCETPGDLYRPVTRSLIGVVLLLVAMWVVLRRRLVWFAAGLGVLVMLLAWRSAWHVDALVWARGGQRWDVISFRGDLRVSRTAKWDQTGPPGYLTLVPGNAHMGANWGLSAERIAVSWRVLGVQGGRDKYQWGTPSVVVVPYAVIAGVVGIVPAGGMLTLGMRRWRRARRRRCNRCESCGYDLRGSGGRCPECGGVR